MTEYQRLEIIKKDLGISYAGMSKKLGLKSPQAFYDIKSGKCGISKDLAKKIQEIFLINATWLLTGEGEMFVKEGKKDTIAGTSSTTTVESLMRMNEVLVESNKGLVESNRSLAESNRLLAESNKTMADMQKSLLEETRSILRRLEKGDAATVVSVADAG